MQREDAENQEAEERHERGADAFQHAVKADHHHHREKRAQDRDEVVLAEELVDLRPEFVQLAPEGREVGILHGCATDLGGPPQFASKNILREIRGSVT